MYSKRSRPTDPVRRTGLPTYRIRNLILTGVLLLLIPVVATAGESDQDRPILRAPAVPVTLEEPLPRPPASRSDCSIQYYYDDTATVVLAWSIPDAYGSDMFNTRFTVEANTVCTLKTIYILMLSLIHI